MKKKLIYLFLIFILVSITIAQILTRSVNLFGLVSWLIALSLTISHYWNQKAIERLFPLDKRDVGIILIFSGIVVLTPWLVHSIPDHFHRDEFVLAHASVTLPALQNIDWFSGYPTSSIAEYPIPYFLIQKLILSLLPTTLLSIRLSTAWYNIAILFYLYILSKRLISSNFAAIASIVFLFLSSNIYMSTLNMHVASSALCVIAFIYHFIHLNKSHHAHAILAGVYLGLSFLFYTASYITLPLSILFIIYQYVINKSQIHTSSLIILYTVFAIILLPFIIHNIFVFPYFYDRINTVSTFTSDQGIYQQNNGNTFSPSTALGIQISQSMLALFLPDIGGTDGYYFGKQALMEPYTFILFMLGFWILVKYCKKKIPFVYILFTICAVVIGYSLTVQPPAFHRLAVIFPLIALSVTLGLYSLAKALSFNRIWIKRLASGFGIMVIIASNSIHFTLMVLQDTQDYPYSTQLANRIREVIPQYSEILIGAYPIFHLGKELFFRTNNQYKFTTIERSQIFDTYQRQPFLLINPSEEEVAYIGETLPTFIFEYFDNNAGETLGFFYETIPSNDDDIIPQ